MSCWMSQNLTVSLGLTLGVKLKVTSSSSSRDRVIVGSTSIPISDLQGRDIRYKYALLNTLDQGRACELEQISLKNFNHWEASKYKTTELYRVMKVPELEIRAGGECWYLPQSHT